MLELRNVTKRFGDIIANDNISLSFKKGEVHSLLGENGAGKSTLISMISGLNNPTSGEIFINGKKVVLDSKSSHTNSIYLLPQHFELIENTSIIDNVLLTRLPFHKKILIDREKVKKDLKKLCDKYDFKINLNKKIYQLTIGQKQVVETLKMLWNESEYMIFDEPTAVLSEKEIESFLKIIEKLKSEGKCIIFISHKFDEVMKVSDLITVLRKGKHVGTVLREKTNKEELTTMMVGKGVSFQYERKKIKSKKKILEVKNLTMDSKTTRKRLQNINFSVNEGEILGIAAIEGNGQDNLFRAIVGTKKTKDESQIFIEGTDVSNMDVEKRYAHGIAYVPADRHRHGLVLSMPVYLNTSLNNYNSKEYYYGGLFFKYKKAKNIASDIVKKYDIRGARDGLSITASMSGGNQQKLLIAREMERNPKLLLLSQPTRGLDLGAIENIYKQVISIRNNNSSVILYSTELEELMRTCDRIMVMSEGKVTKILNKDEFSKENIGKWMS